jgi:hypothetical protein
MSLRDDIEKFNEQMTKDMPEEIRTTLEEEALALAQSGIVAKSVKEGDKAPSFSLPNIEGKLVSSADLLSRGPLVVSFYRGGW